jgi:hydrogenase expression/formation protein HypE
MTGFTCAIPGQNSDHIQLAHGGGGLLMHQLIERVFRPRFLSGEFTHDGALLDPGPGRLAFTTDSYVVRPLFFPGGDIGSLAVNGTINDLAMCGARPLYLSAAFILEEGLPISTLERVAASMQSAAAAAGVKLVTGDTKVVERGKGDGIYINTSGIGVVPAHLTINPSQIRAGDTILLSGDIARHGIAVMAAREGLAFEPAIESDTAALAVPVQALIAAGIEIHCLRDPTRGGPATTLAELAGSAGLEITINERAIPISPPVRGACEILGLDPLYVANEGRFLAFVPAHHAPAALKILQNFNPTAAIIGETAAGKPQVILQGLIGGKRVLDMMAGEQLPRIC